MTTHIFEEVRRSGTKTVRCTGCGKRLVRTRTFTNTLNPWNVNEDGTPRTWGEIWDRLGAKVAAWQAEPEHHVKCLAALATPEGTEPK